MSSATSAGLRFLQQPPAGPRFLQQTPSRPQLKNPIVGRQAVQANDPLYFIREKQWVVQTTHTQTSSKPQEAPVRLWVVQLACQLLSKPQKQAEGCGSSSKAVGHQQAPEGPRRPQKGCGSFSKAVGRPSKPQKAPEGCGSWVVKPQKAPEGCKAVGRPASPRRLWVPERLWVVLQAPEGPRRLWVVQQSCGSSCKPQKAPEGCGSSSKTVGRPVKPQKAPEACG